jgi:hypothetical protein
VCSSDLNGDISGSNGSFVTGDAFVADPPALYANQSNGEAGTPPYSITVGKTSNQDFAQSFQVTETSEISKFQLYIKKVGFPSNAYILIYTDNNGKPYADPYAGHNPIAGGTIYAGGIATFYSWFDVATYSANAMLLPGVTYWLVIDCQNSQSSNYYVIGANQSYPNGYGLTGIISPSVYKGSWTNTNPSQLDMYFKIFFGGGHGFISNVDVGANGTGDANVYTLTNSAVVGNAYCKTGTGNNKSCDTSHDVPEPEEMPISDSMINGWKADAEAGGTIDGNLTISGTQTLGPKKINGNLTITGTVTITNTIWVTGSINISGTVKLNPSYLATSGIIISDKYIYIANNSVFQDSGTAGSYIMVLSTSSCDSVAGANPCGAYNAIEVKNNSNLIIANAQKGAVAFQNNAGVKEVVANRIYLANNSTVSYGSGLMNVNFTSGTSGVWDIDGWKEVE